MYEGWARGLEVSKVQVLQYLDRLKVSLKIDQQALQRGTEDIPSSCCLIVTVDIAALM